MSRFPVTDHCDGTRFFNPGAPPLPSLLKVLRWRFTRRVPDWQPVNVSPKPAPKTPAADSPGLTATWVNHSTFLLQLGGLSLLTDPVFGERIGLFGRIGPRRVHAPGLAFETLPRIDAILLSHDHYDHCDLPTLRRLAARDNPLVLAPLGHRPLLQRARLNRVIELDWWQTHSLIARPDTSATSSEAPPISVTLTPSLHWSNRATGPKCGRLWGGFFVSSPTRSFFFAGDTGYDPTLFGEIARRLGSPNLALLPIGAYEPRWFMRDQHINPAEAVQIHRELGARQSLGMHWGTFQLTDEPRLAPPAALRDALADARLSQDLFRIMEPGQSLTV